MARRKTKSRNPLAQKAGRDTTETGHELADLIYDYELVPEEYRDEVRRSAMSIKFRLKRAAEDILIIGQELKNTKSRLLYGQYTQWLDIEFGLSIRMAQRFVNVLERLGSRNDIMSFLPPTALYMLSAKSTPDEAIEEVEKRIQNGHRIGVSQVQAVIREVKKRVNTVEIEGEVISAETVDDETNDEQNTDKELAQWLDIVLGQAFDLLEGEPDEKWGQLFKNSELTRVRNEIYQLRELVRTKIE